MRAMLIAILACACGTAVAWELPATRRAMMMDAMTAPAASSTLGDGLIAHWLLNENAANTSVSDTKGSHNGTATANTSTLHINSGNPPNLNGALQTTADSTSVATTGSFTNINNSGSYSVWIKRNTGKHLMIFNPQVSGFYLYLLSDGRMIVDNSPQPVVNPTAGVWYHAVVTWTNHATNTVVYWNGTNVYSGTCSFTSKSFATNSTISIGGTGTGNSGGAWDDVRIYNRVLTSNEVVQLYNGGAGTEAE